MSLEAFTTEHNFTTVHDFGPVLSCCEPCVKNEQGKKVVLTITFVLVTFDMITDWINWKEWSTAGGYNQHYFTYIFTTAFLCVAIVGTVLWIVEVSVMVTKIIYIYRRSPRIYAKKDLEEDDESNKRHLDEENQRNEKGTFLNRLGIAILVCIGLLEDLPVVSILYTNSLIPFCGVSARRELGSGVTIAAIVSSMLNSLWTMIVIYFELCSCGATCLKLRNCCRTNKEGMTGAEHEYRGNDKEGGDNEIRCKEEKEGEKTECRSETRSKEDKKIEKDESREDESISAPNKEDKMGEKDECLKSVFIAIGRVVLCVTIFLLFLSTFVLGLLTLGHINGSFSLRFTSKSGRYILFDTVHIVDSYGPGLDAKNDEAMFINLVYELPHWYQVTVYDNEDYPIAESASAFQVQNRLYIGKFDELSHLKEGTLPKAIPCTKVMSFLDKIDESVFYWKDPQKTDDIDFSDCKIIFTLRYYPENRDWNPFKNIIHDFYRDITVEWGIHIKNANICPTGIKPVSPETLLTEQVEQDIAKYTCNSACEEDENICQGATSGRFHLSRVGKVLLVANSSGKLRLTVNNLKSADSCIYETNFNYSRKFCDESWADVEPVNVPEEIQSTYPQFITFPASYDRPGVRDGFCRSLWSSEWRIWWGYDSIENTHPENITDQNNIYGPLPFSG